MARRFARASTMTPIGTPSRNSGTPSIVCVSPIAEHSPKAVFRIRSSRPRMCTARRSSAARPQSCRGLADRMSRSIESSGFGREADRCRDAISSPRGGDNRHRRLAQPTRLRPRVSSTGRRSKVERLMTLSTSLVAVWYSSDSCRSSVRSRNSPSSRAFSIAITACAAKFCNSAICLSVNGRTSWR